MNKKIIIEIPDNVDLNSIQPDRLKGIIEQHIKNSQDIIYLAAVAKGWLKS